MFHANQPDMMLGVHGGFSGVNWISVCSAVSKDQCSASVRRRVGCRSMRRHAVQEESCSRGAFECDCFCSIDWLRDLSPKKTVAAMVQDAIPVNTWNHLETAICAVSIVQVEQDSQR